jgi:hypothetical protein
MGFWRTVGPLWVMLLWGAAMGVLIGYGLWGAQ